MQGSNQGPTKSYTPTSLQLHQIVSAPATKRDTATTPKNDSATSLPLITSVHLPTTTESRRVQTTPRETCTDDPTGNVYKRPPTRYVVICFPMICKVSYIPECRIPAINSHTQMTTDFKHATWIVQRVGPQRQTSFLAKEISCQSLIGKRLIETVNICACQQCNQTFKIQRKSWPSLPQANFEVVLNVLRCILIMIPIDL